MKILHTCGSFPPAYAYGGPPRSVHNLTSALASRGHDVTVYTTDAMDAETRINPSSQPSTVDGVEVNRFRNLSNWLAWRNIQIPPMMLAQLLQNVSEFDVVHTHEFRAPPMVFAHLVSSYTGVPHVHQPRGSVPRFERSTLKSIFDIVLGEKMIASIDALIASSRVESSKYTEVFPNLDTEKIWHIPNGISSENYREIPSGGEFRNKHEIGTDESIILFLSRLHPRKGGDLLIRAVHQLSRDDVRLVFVGPDEGAQNDWKLLAENLDIQNKTEFIGPLYGPEKMEAYVDADVFVLPSKNEYESFGNVAIEAMACGTPAITTDVCGVAEWLDHTDCYVVRPSASELCESIEHVLDTGVAPPSHIRRYVSNNFTWDSIAKNTEEVYYEVLE